MFLTAYTSLSADMFVYFGTHRSGTNIGFSLAHFDTDTGSLTRPQFLQQARDPAYFVIHPDGRHLYTVNEVKPGEVSAYSINPKTGRLKFLNKQPTGGDGPAYISLDRKAHFALAANYGGGSVAVFALKSSGSLGERTAFIQHEGRSVHPERQTQPHAHSIITDPSNRFALVADLGLDKIIVYSFNEKDGSLAVNDPPFAMVPPGSGPRHIKFHPNGRWAYVINEIACNICAFKWNSERGTLQNFQIVSTLPDDSKVINTSAEIEVHPGGKFLYASNRGRDSLVAYSIDPATGELALIGSFSSGGLTPRNFAFDPAGKWILCSNHGSECVVVFRIDETSGRLTQTGLPVPAPYPFCERFLPAR